MGPSSLSATSVILGAALCVASAFGQTVQSSADLSKLEADAYAAYATKNYPESIRLYDRAVALTQGSLRANDEYNEACSLALNDDRDRALMLLSHSVDDGWGDYDHTSTDTDLTSLHGDPRFATILDRIAVVQKAENMRWGTAAFKSSYSPEISGSDKVAGLSLLWAEAKFGFANFWHVPDLDWDATYRSYIPKVLATKSTLEYYEVLQRFYALLQDGHTGVGHPTEPTRLPFRWKRIPLMAACLSPAFIPAISMRKGSSPAMKSSPSTAFR